MLERMGKETEVITHASNCLLCHSWGSLLLLKAISLNYCVQLPNPRQHCTWSKPDGLRTLWPPALSPPQQQYWPPVFIPNCFIDVLNLGEFNSTYYTKGKVGVGRKNKHILKHLSKMKSLNIGIHQELNQRHNCISSMLEENIAALDLLRELNRILNINLNINHTYLILQL